MADDFAEVLRFWFRFRFPRDRAEMVRQSEWWFRGGADSEIVARFVPLLERAARGELDSWSRDPRSRLAHAEDLIHLDQTIELADELVEQAPPDVRWWLAFSASQARGQRDVVARFGRHPHRNQVLGRQSTAAELEYLAKGELVHTRALPDDES